MQPIHDRMPVILPRELETLWLDPAVADPALLAEALAPFPAEGMAAYEVAVLVNKPANDGPEVMAPLGKEASGPGAGPDRQARFLPFSD